MDSGGEEKTSALYELKKNLVLVMHIQARRNQYMTRKLYNSPKIQRARAATRIIGTRVARSNNIIIMTGSRSFANLFTWRFRVHRHYKSLSDAHNMEFVRRMDRCAQSVVASERHGARFGRVGALIWYPTAQNGKTICRA